MAADQRKPTKGAEFFHRTLKNAFGDPQACRVTRLSRDGQTVYFSPIVYSAGRDITRPDWAVWSLDDFRAHCLLGWA